jgi:hypothetical protein
MNKMIPITWVQIEHVPGESPRKRVDLQCGHVDYVRPSYRLGKRKRCPVCGFMIQPPLFPLPVGAG